MAPKNRRSRVKEPNFRKKCGVVNRYLIGASTAHIKNPAEREAVAKRIGRGTSIEPIESHQIKPEGDYITLGRTETKYAILHNPRTGRAVMGRAKTRILLPKAVINDLWRVNEAREAGMKAELKPESRRLLRHEGKHWLREVTGQTRATKVRLEGAWERDPKQLKRDVDIVFGKKLSKNLLEQYPTRQIEGVLEEVHEERKADEASIAGDVNKRLQHLGARPITNPKQYMDIVKASAKEVLRGRPEPYKRAVLADIAMMEARMKGVKFQKPKGPTGVERLANKIARFSGEVIGGFGNIGVSPMEAVRLQGPGGKARTDLREAA
jgi:hypothetical protein